MRSMAERVVGLRRWYGRLRCVPALLRVLRAAVVVEWQIRRLPIRELAARNGLVLDLSPHIIQPHGSASSLTPAERRGVRAARWVLRRWPLGSGPCLRESLVVGHLLRHRAPHLRLGVVPDRAGIIAHAWVELDGHRLGYDRRYTAFQADRASDNLSSREGTRETAT